MRVLMIVLLVAGCRSEPPPPPTANRAAAEWQLEALADIAPGGDSAFTRLVSLTADRDGNIYAADRGTGQVRVFDSLGAPVSVIGRRGRGPGEFREIYALAWAGDTLAVLDPGNQRVELLGRDGAWRGSRPGARVTGEGVRLYQRGPHAFYVPGFRPVGQGIQRLLLLSGPGETHDTIVVPAFPASASKAGGMRCSVAGGGIGWFGSPWDSEVLMAISPRDEVVMAQSADYRLEYFNRAGATQRIVMFGVVPVPIAEAEWDSVLARNSASREKVGARDCEPETLPRPAARPALRAIEFDDEGRLWVEAAMADGFNFHIYDSTSTQIANFRAPERDPAVPFVVRDGRLYLVVTGVSGHQAIRAYRLPAAARMAPD